MNFICYIRSYLKHMHTCLHTPAHIQINFGQIFMPVIEKASHYPHHVSASMFFCSHFVIWASLPFARKSEFAMQKSLSNKCNCNDENYASRVANALFWISFFYSPRILMHEKHSLFIHIYIYTPVWVYVAYLCMYVCVCCLLYAPNLFYARFHLLHMEKQQTKRKLQ